MTVEGSKDVSTSTQDSECSNSKGSVSSLQMADYSLNIGFAHQIIAAAYYYS
ncbi:MAG: hypothetical protein J6R79_06055 [Bacteroidaceae bacterium]|nr:hypothetical protein [Bacteroidaceae bacterium]